MAFKMKSGNKVSFKKMGSSPAKQSVDTKTVVANNKATKKAQLNSNTPEDKQYTKRDIKESTKTNKLKSRGLDTPGGSKITAEEEYNTRKTQLIQKGKRAASLEAAGKGEKGFSWKKAGMAVLQGQGLMGAAMAGIGTGRDKSAIMKDRLTKLEGNKERREIEKQQSDNRKAVKTQTRKEARATKKAERKARLKKNIDLSDI